MADVLLSRMHPLCYRMRYDTCVVLLNKKCVYEITYFPLSFLSIFELPPFDKQISSALQHGTAREGVNKKAERNHCTVVK